MDTPPEEVELLSQIFTVRLTEMRARLMDLQTAIEQTPAHDPERRAGLQAELDATVAHFKELQAQRRRYGIRRRRE